MRCVSIVLGLFLFCSCTALKPAGASRASREVNPAANRGFIENITITPAANNYNSQPAVHNNPSGNPFSANPDIPVVYLPMQFKYAILMDLPVETLVNLKLFSFIDDWYGTPYRFGGNSKTGIDCSAFCSNLMVSVFGIGLPRMAREQYKVCNHLHKNELEEGDLVFFHTTRKGISHVGVYLGNNKFVHASLNYGVVISDLNDPYYARTFRAGGRIRQETAPASPEN